MAADIIRPRTVLELIKDPAHTRKISFGDSVLNETFGGGLPGHGIIEFAGMAGSGKTQLMVQLLIAHQAKAYREAKATGRMSRCFLLSTEGTFPTRRLRDMASTRYPNDPAFAQFLLETVVLAEAKNVDEQLFILTTKLPELLSDVRGGPIRLCIVDSISGLFRGEYGRDDAVDRAQITFAMAKTMKKLAHLHGLPFVVTNQVTADFSGGSASAEQAVQPALGLSWSHCVHTRFMLTRRDAATELPAAAGGGAPQSSAFWREMKLVLSPMQAVGRGCQYVIEESRVRGLRDSGSAAHVGSVLMGLPAGGAGGAAGMAEGGRGGAPPGGRS